jgi:hypothetical protein
MAHTFQLYYTDRDRLCMEALAVIHYLWLQDEQFLGLDLYKLRMASALFFFFSMRLVYY